MPEYVSFGPGKWVEKKRLDAQKKKEEEEKNTKERQSRRTRINKKTVTKK